MNVYRMRPESILQISCNTIDIIENAPIISLSNPEIYDLLEMKLRYSYSHIRGIFEFATGISLTKYIIRRKYTLILLSMSYADFCKLRKKSTHSGILGFKSKCLDAFKSVTAHYTEESLQPAIDKSRLLAQIIDQIEKEEEAQFFKSLNKEITQDRSPFDIGNGTKHLILQTAGRKLVDLDTTYFTYRNKVFNVTATHTYAPQEYINPFGQNFFDCLSPETPCSANETLQLISQFLSGDSIFGCKYSVLLNCCGARSWNYSNLISSTTIAGSTTTDITFNNNPFIIFDNDSNVVLDLSYFERG